MARKKRGSCYSGIGGQAVLEGVMMKNKDKYAVAVRKPNGEIAVETEHYHGVLADSKIKEFPFIRGVFNFLDSMILGMKVLNYSAEFYEEEEPKKDDAKGSGISDKLLTTIVTVVSIVLAVGIFVVLPYLLTAKFAGNVLNPSLLAIIEGAVRIVIFLLYVCGISLMKDIRRLYQYHGAEHKCINCVEKGRPLTVRNVKKSSRFHRRCGTSFLFFVMIVSIVLFFFIRVENVALRIVLRILLMPVIAGISYEFIRFAGRHEGIFVKLLSAPGVLLQCITTKEPDTDMIEVAIASVEAVFDWRAYLQETFGYAAEESRPGDEPREDEEYVEGPEDVYYVEETFPEEATDDFF